MKKLITLGVLMYICTYSFGQHTRCYSTEMHQKKYAADANYRINYDQSQKRLSDALTQLSAKNIMPTPPYTIPVVVHVVHNNGAENISDAQIQSQIQVLNEDFRKIASSRGDGAGVDSQIEFCMASIDPSGNPTNGITRNVSSTYTDLNINTEDGGLKSIVHWDQTKYLNFYIVRRICDGNGVNCGILGYAYFTNAGAIDGVVCGYNYYGTSDLDDGSFSLSAPYDLGRTMTHEVGHWFNLYHTFQSGCTNNTCTTNGDRVCDTPPVSSPNFGCPSGTNTCSTDNNDASYPFPDVNDYIDDYMDYTDDNCMSRYTQGQADRMVAAVMSNNSNIYSSSNLIATGCGSTLNMELMSFEAEQKGNLEMLKWESIEEKNFIKYEIERCGNDLKFGKIGETTKQNFIDRSPLDGNNYYRIKINKRDQKYSYSRTIEVIYNSGVNVKVFPNPINDNLFIECNSDEDLLINIYNIYGGLETTLNKKNTNSNPVNINTENLEKGIYLIEVNRKNHKDVFKVIKQ